MSLKRQDSQELTMKKLTLTAWARILYRKGMIDAAKLGRMITIIEDLKKTKAERKTIFDIPVCVDILRPRFDNLRGTGKLDRKR